MHRISRLPVAAALLGLVALDAAAGETSAAAPVTADTSLLFVGQTLDGAQGRSGLETRYNARLDLELRGRGPGWEGSGWFLHARAGKGGGLRRFPDLAALPNGTVFEDPRTSGDAALTLAQAWYQLNLPLSSDTRLEFNLGKMDPFGFFDQNEVANDEAQAFLNAAFVNNPLLGLGDGLGGDRFGFAPGLRAAYAGEIAGVGYGLSAGVFGAGEGATMPYDLDQPAVIVQAEVSPRGFGQAGNYRVYLWQLEQAEGLVGDEATHRGVGVSLDQGLSEDLAVFARYGYQLKGEVAFNRAFTLGAGLKGGSWGRADDTLGLALGWRRTSGEFRAQAATLDADGDGTPDYGYAPNSTEQIAEVFYRLQVNRYLEVTPDLQYLRHPGADDGADNLWAAAVRLRLAL